MKLSHEDVMTHSVVMFLTKNFLKEISSSTAIITTFVTKGLMGRFEIGPKVCSKPG
jgi:hypothetical protein